MSNRYILDFSGVSVGDPVIYALIKEYGIKVNILRAEINSNQHGSMLVEFDAPMDALEKAFGYLKDRSVTLLPLSEALAWREADCVDCGACTGVCFSGCLSMGMADWKLGLDRDKCVACGLCVKACPFGLFSLRFGD